MNITNSLQTILCAGVSHLILPRSATKLLAKQGDGQLLVRERVRRKPKARRESRAVESDERLPQ